MAEPRRTAYGNIDRRTKAGRLLQQRRSVGEIEDMLALIHPATQMVARRYDEAARRVVEFRAAHPELAEMEADAMNAMAENNEAIRPIWSLLNELREQDIDKWNAWCAFYNAEGPQPKRG